MSDTPYENLDIGYYEFPLPNTEEFQTVRFLNKEGLARLWNKVGDKFMRPPTGGTVGQAIVKTETGIAWGDVSSDPQEIPDLPDMNGVLPIEKGGTGCTTIDGIRTILFNFPTSEQLFSDLGLN